MSDVEREILSEVLFVRALVLFACSLVCMAGGLGRLSVCLLVIAGFVAAFRSLAVAAGWRD